MRSDKRGISAIVATVLIILITVAAVTIIWAAIIPMIQDNLTSGENFETRAEVITSEGWSIYDKESNILMVQVKATGDFSKMEFVITNEGNSKTIEITDVPLNNQKKTYTWTETDSTYNITELELGDSDSVTVKVIPYLVDGGSEKIGTISAEVTLKSKKSNVETTIPETGEEVDPATNCGSKNVGDTCFNSGTCDNFEGTLSCYSPNLIDTTFNSISNDGTATWLALPYNTGGAYPTWVKGGDYIYYKSSSCNPEGSTLKQLDVGIEEYGTYLVNAYIEVEGNPSQFDGVYFHLGTENNEVNYEYKLEGNNIANSEVIFETSQNGEYDEDYFMIFYKPSCPISNVNSLGFRDVSVRKKLFSI